MRVDVKKIEIAHLELRYAHTRIRDIQAERRLCASLECYGQITPVVVVPGKPPRHVLLDGYLRVAGVKRLGRDTIMAEIREHEKDALLEVLASNQARRWDIFEQAELIKEIMIRFDFSQADMARHTGKSESFISRRLLLLESLDDELRKHVRQGRISIWSATRVLAPLARANEKHASQLMRRLIAQPLTTRELTDWFKNYQKSNKKIRTAMVENPHMVLKALNVRSEALKAATIKKGPEGRWVKDIKIVTRMVKRLSEDIDMVFYENQSDSDRRLLQTAFDAGVLAFNELMEKIRRINATHRNEEHHSATACTGRFNPENQQTCATLTQSGPASP